MTDKGMIEIQRVSKSTQLKIRTTGAETCFIVSHLRFVERPLPDFFYIVKIAQRLLFSGLPQSPLSGIRKSTMNVTIYITARGRNNEATLAVCVCVMCTICLRHSVKARARSSSSRTKRHFGVVRKGTFAAFTKTCGSLRGHLSTHHAFAFDDWSWRRMELVVHHFNEH